MSARRRCLEGGGRHDRARLPRSLLLAWLTASGCRLVDSIPAVVTPAGGVQTIDVELEIVQTRPGVDSTLITHKLDGRRSARLEWLAGEGVVFTLPLTVNLVGEGESKRYEYLDSGWRVRRRSVRFGDAEGPLGALRTPPLAALWSAAHSQGRKVLIGQAAARRGAVATLAGPPRTRAPLWPGTLEAQGLEKTPEDPTAHVDDPRNFLPWAAVDCELIMTLPFASGAWSPGERREEKLAIEHTRDFPALEGEVGLTYLGIVHRPQPDLRLFEFDVVWGGPVWPRPVLYGDVLERRARGELLLSKNGHVAEATYSLEASQRLGRSVLDRTSTRVNLRGREATEQEDTWRETPGGRLGRLLALRRTSPPSFQRELLEATFLEALPLLASVRPGSGIERAKPVVRRPDLNLAALRRGARHRLDRLDPKALLALCGEILTPLGIATRSQLESLATRLGPRGPRNQALCASHSILSRDLLLVEPAAAGNLESVLHQAAHLIAGRLGYGDESNLLLGGRELAGPEAMRWVDIDGALATWLLLEAEAQLSVREALAVRTGFRKDRNSPLHALHSNSGTSEPLWAPLCGALRRITRIREQHASLEAALANNWRTFSFQSRQLLAASEAGSRSRLWSRLARLAERETLDGATRVGALLLRWPLVRSGALDWQEANALASELTDDVALRRGTNILWLSEWADEAAASHFAKLHSSTLDSGTVRVLKTAVVVTIGAPKGFESLLSALLEHDSEAPAQPEPEGR